jgi:3-isopropylmalate/(R)-2-methylmalate dehydratase small subunit
MKPVREIRSRTVVLAAENVDTDQIIPARFLVTTTREGLGRGLFADWRWDADGRPKPGFALNRPEAEGARVLVAGRNFGCGSSREHAPLAIKGAGISCVIAQSFARIFFRNAINIGLPVLECPQAEEIEEGHLLEVDLASGEIKDITRGRMYKAVSYPPFMLEIVRAGGLVEYTRRKLSGK